MARVRRGVAALVVRVDDDVEAHQLVEGLVIEAEHLAKVARVVQLRVILGHHAVEVRDAVDDGAYLRQAGDQVEHVLVRVLPVLFLAGALGVLAREHALRLQRQDRRRELRHRVHALGEGADHRLDVRGQLGTRVEVGGERVALLLGGHLARQQEPEQRLRRGLAAGLVAGKLLLQLRDRVSSEADALERVEERGLPEHRLDAAGATDELINGHLVDDLGAVLLLHLSERLLLDRHQLNQALLEDGRAAHMLLRRAHEARGTAEGKLRSASNTRTHGRC